MSWNAERNTPIGSLVIGCRAVTFIITAGLFFSIHFLLLVPTASAQIHVWSKLIGAPGVHDGGHAIATDKDGNVIVAGTFSNSINLGGSTLVSAGSDDIYVAKFSPSGSHIWSRSIGGSGTDTVNGITSDADGNIVVLGQFSGQANYGGGNLSSYGATDIFLASYAKSNGAYRWSKHFGGTGNDTAYSLVATSTGDIIIAAGFQGNATFGGATLTSAGGYDLALARYAAADGTHRWSRSYGGENSEDGSSVAIDEAADQLVVSGYFDTSADVGTGTLRSLGLTDAFLAAYSATDGTPRWSKSFGGTGYDTTADVAVDANGNITLVGYFALFGGAVDFGGGSVESHGGADTFIASYKRNGAYRWAVALGGGADDYPNAVAVDSGGNATVTGYFQGSADFGGPTLTSAGQFDMFLVKYSASGQYIYSGSFGGVVTDKGTDLAYDSSNYLYATGYVGYDINFGGNRLVTDGYSDGFLVKFAPLEGTPTPAPSHTPTPRINPTSTPTRVPSATPTTAPLFGLSGSVLYYANDRPVPGVSINVPGANPPTVQTNFQGNYQVNGLALTNWTVSATKESDFGSGISALDAAYALQAAAGSRTLTPDQELACDVTGNGALSALDAARILQFAVGQMSSFDIAHTCGSDWLFVPEPQQAPFQTLNLPLTDSDPCVHGSISFNPLTVNATGQNFRAILLGDCTGNWDSGAAFQRVATAPAKVRLGRLRQMHNGHARLPVYVQSSQPFYSLDLYLRYDASMTVTGTRIRRASAQALATFRESGSGAAAISLASAEPLDGRHGTQLVVEFATSAPVPRKGAVRVIGGMMDEKPLATAR
jgi:Beta-propeller repeat